ncbi:hypothetical protein ACN38_g7612 [Penicillium nordicum]|uniref:Uncharacterized protein n=1 Tax=Penicillium nordicum TaxID=229535 RepID=A0A0M8NXV0_9EURO|nr:hypothetical protein ACN38_g7612 [Penicillium nordicum]
MSLSGYHQSPGPFWGLNSISLKSRVKSFSNKNHTPKTTEVRWRRSGTHVTASLGLWLVNMIVVEGLTLQFYSRHGYLTLLQQLVFFCCYPFAYSSYPERL